MHNDDRPMQPVDATQTTSDIEAGGVASGSGSDVESDPSATDPSSTHPMAPARTATEADPTTESRADASQPRPPEMSPAACAARLAGLFPAVFGQRSPLPLKLKIQSDIQQRSPGVFTRRQLSGFLQRYTTGSSYLKALANSPDRIDLDGVPAGPVNEEHRAAAVAELQRRRALQDERRAFERDAARKAHEEARRADEAARQANEAEGGARAARASLLRAFETTTLTRANFCALKGVAEAELDAAIAQARQERERHATAPLAPLAAPAYDMRRQPNEPRSERAGPNDRGRSQARRPPGLAKPPR